MAAAELLDLKRALELHGDRWRELAVERGNAFVTPEWAATWSRHYADLAVGRAAVIRGSADSRPIGLVAFAVDRSGFPRTARLAGGTLADYLHPVAAATDEATVAAAAVAAIADELTGSSALVLENVDADASWSSEAPSNFRMRERSDSVCPFASLAGGGYDDYLARRSSSFRKQLRRFDRRLEREARIELRQTERPEQLTADLETFFRLHFLRWAKRGGSSLAAGRAREFHADFAAAALERGWLRLLIMEADGEPIAAFYGWRVGGRFAFYQAGFDDSWSRFSVGLVLHGRVIERAIAEGAEEYDMLLGSEPYKFRFCESARRVTTRILSRRWRPAGLAVAADVAGRRLARRMPESVRGGLSSLERRLPTGRHR